MTLEQLLARLQEINTESQAIVDKAKAENRDLSDDETKQIDALDDEFTKVKGNADRLERIAQQRQHLDSSPGRQTDPTNPASDPPRGSTGRVPGTARDHEREGWGPFADAGDFGMAVYQSCLPGATVDQRLTQPYAADPTNFHSESSDGYLIPPQMRQEIWEIVYSGNDLLNMVSPEPTQANSVEMLADETTPWGASGVKAYWRSEAQQMTATKTSADNRTVKLNEMYVFVEASDELLEDAPRLSNRLTNHAGRAIRWKSSDAIAYGDGVGKPLGYYDSAALVTVAQEAEQEADTINATNVVKMFSRLLVTDGSKPVWLANSDILPQLMVMTVGDTPIWTPPNGFAGAPGGFLLGIPIQFSQHAKTLGDKGDLQLIDPMGYYAATKRTVQAASSIHLYFDRGVTAFRWTFRMGGQPFLSAPVAPAHGTATKSHFVVLEERAGGG
ncbi:Phage capsid family protein [Planctomycetes bacterium Pan216]|uniref:Phage capsid family protein n=1 Tax=Kolteria novifilia TaxID=2527975 RepID=A0A518B5B1_9BACT|nr:Phage capsid family protein [Planctomycetes bacterium Pan216]